MAVIRKSFLSFSNDRFGIIGTAAGLAMAFAAGYVADRVDRPHLKPSVNTGVVTSVGAFTVAVIAVVSCFVRM